MYREATPPLHLSAQLEAYSLHSVPGSSYPSSLPPSEPLPSQLVYQRDTRDKQTDRDLDSTHSSALESTEVRYLNDQPALDTLRTKESTPKAQIGMDSQDSSPCPASTSGCIRRGESTSSTSPGSASQRLENLRRHQPDDKLEKLKERIRRQRQHLEEAAEREKLLGYLESNNPDTSKMPTTKIRKVTTAPPAPIYKGNLAFCFVTCLHFFEIICVTTAYCFWILELCSVVGNFPFILRFQQYRDKDPDSWWQSLERRRVSQPQQRNIQRLITPICW